MNNAGLSICGVTEKPMLLNHSKKIFLHMYQILAAAFFDLSHFCHISILNFMKFLISSIVSNMPNFVLLQFLFDFDQNSVFLHYFIIGMA